MLFKGSLLSLDEETVQDNRLFFILFLNSIIFI